jgi:hypothetical protein
VSQESISRLPFVIAVPPVAVGIAAIVLTVLGRFGMNPFWPSTPVTLSEAAALRDQSTLVVMLEEGADPDRAYPIRAGLIDDEPLVLTPMEGAIHEDRSEIAHLLLKHGVTVTPAVMCGWLADAAEYEAEDVPRLLASRYPAETAACRRGM